MKAQHKQELQHLRQGDVMHDLAAILQVRKGSNGLPVPAADLGFPQAKAVSYSSCPSTLDIPDLSAKQAFSPIKDTSASDKRDAKDLLGEFLGNLDFCSDAILPAF
jgi:hypothetical protein